MPTATLANPLTDLGRTATYKHRECEVYPLGVVGRWVAIVRLWKTKAKDPAKAIRSVYVVEKDAPGLYEFRCVWGESAGAVYGVEMADRSCSCDAGVAGNTSCKHMAVCTRAIEGHG